MKTVENIIIRLLIVQLILLVVVQIFFHKNNIFPELQEIVQYEGVVKNHISGWSFVFGGQATGIPDY